MGIILGKQDTGSGENILDLWARARRSFEVTILSFPNMCYNDLAVINVIFITSI